MTNIPQIASVENTLMIYYENPEISSAQIREIFDCGSTKASALKKIALEQQTEDNKSTYSTKTVNTVSAFKSWGIDINDLEQRAMKLKKLRK